MARRRGRLSGDAELLLGLVANRYPEGVPVSEAALIIYGKDSPEARARTYRLARSLRDVGHMVYAIGRAYHLCNGDPEKLLRVGQLKEGPVFGGVDGFLKVLDGIAEALEAVPGAVEEALVEELKARARTKLEAALRKLAS
ncbi:hypothetical protein [Desulfovirgula thermocuniculi]|uniref:hypothetical protein n=1 Tax=Desulfovirgula thermocuniculi TaxID=348842 RepID=UPI000412F419|nr:hypothetical protein [Desulfovirgula thermocuniculi]